METKEDRKSLMLLTWHLFTLYLRNDHTVLSLFQRTAGTNWSLRQRLGCFFVYICTIMVATGMYYGTDYPNIWQDVIASFMISLIATTPGFIIRKMFEYSKPKQEHFAKQPSVSRSHPEFEGVESSSINLEENMQTVMEMRQKFFEWMFPFPSC